MTNEARNNLILSMNDPSNILYSDEFVVIIADQYPKSEHHYLVMPKEDLFDVRSLKKHHIPKLIYMELKGLEYVMHTTGLFAQDLLVGYHAFTSMNRLHLHVLSKDLCGPHMRLPQQWNSFNTEFFIPTHKIISELQSIGHVVLPSNKKMLHQPVQCDKCDFLTNEIKHLKLHLEMVHYVPQNV
ncbi:hypothetical protein QTP88_025491 [Uroleucon formosanum]